jgi:hypothetical protein
MNIKCKKYTVLKNKQKLNTNYIYKVLKIEKDNFTIINEIDNITLIVPISVINSHFKYPYSCTIDSIQGKSISTDLTIFDADLSYMSRRRLYTAITRARSLDKVTFFINSDDKRNQFKDFRITQYFKFKIANYENQDKLKTELMKRRIILAQNGLLSSSKKIVFVNFVIIHLIYILMKKIMYRQILPRIESIMIYHIQRITAFYLATFVIAVGNKKII